ncbi:MAG: hypothetical protein IT292_02455 [Deltaproteobacteria bacterium]|nr:hypothetical protein [Deltaproteobacteria bacterium]
MSLPILTIILIAIGLAMEAFAVSITRGVACKERNSCTGSAETGQPADINNLVTSY